MNKEAYNKQYFKDLATNALHSFSKHGLDDVLANLLELTFWEGHRNGWWVEEEQNWKEYTEESKDIHQTGAGDKDD